MTRSGRLAGLLAVLLLLIVLSIGVWIGRTSGLALEPSFAWPLLPAFPAPVIDIGFGPTGSNASTTIALCPPLAAFVAWLIRRRHHRWSRIALDHAVPNDLPIPAPPAPAPPAMPAPPAAQGPDLAARARFVALSFAFPEAGPARVHAARSGLTDWPLQIDCQPIRFTLTLRHAALAYALTFCNRGADPLGPMIIRADLASTSAQTVQDRAMSRTGDALPLCHYLDSLPPGAAIELTGELRLPLADVAAMRLGAAELLVPLLRLYAESAGDVGPALSTATSFAIGLPPLSAGSGMQPFRLDLGPGIWRKLTARRVIGTDLR